MEDMHCFMPCAAPGARPAGTLELQTVNMKRMTPDEKKQSVALQQLGLYMSNP